MQLGDMHNSRCGRIGIMVRSHRRLKQLAIIYYIILLVMLGSLLMVMMLLLFARSKCLFFLMGSLFSDFDNVRRYTSGTMCFGAIGLAILSPVLRLMVENAHQFMGAKNNRDEEENHQTKKQIDRHIQWMFFVVIFDMFFGVVDIIYLNNIEWFTIQNIEYEENQKYVGEIINDRADGFGTTYDTNGAVMIRGEFRDGVLNGVGKEYSIYNDGKRQISFIVSDGYYVKGIKEGIFNEWTYKGNERKRTFEGSYQRGKRNGKGIQYEYDGDRKITIDAFWVNGEVNGFGTETEEMAGEKAMKYVGNFREGKFDGLGQLQFTDDSNVHCVYSGYFKNGKYHGKGTLYKGDASHGYPGEYKDGRIKRAGDVNGIWDYPKETIWDD